jgi:hypothetical protein
LCAFDDGLDAPEERAKALQRSVNGRVNLTVEAWPCASQESILFLSIP